jgi:hypothetical protein
MNQILSGAEISFRGLNRRVAKQQLNLLKVSAGRPAELRAGTSQVMGRDAGNADLGSVTPKHLPNDLFTQALSSDGPTAIIGCNLAL